MELGSEVRGGVVFSRPSPGLSPKEKETKHVLDGERGNALRLRLSAKHPSANLLSPSRASQLWACCGERLGEGQATSLWPDRCLIGQRRCHD